jgi:hypothetical protein
LRPILNLFDSSRFQNDVWFQNVKGFNELTPTETTAALSSSLDSSTTIQVINVVFAFYRQGRMLASDECSMENYGSKTNFFGQIKELFLTDNVFYDSIVCPFFFMNTRLEQLFSSLDFEWTPISK